MLSMKSMEFHLWVWKLCGVWHRPGQPHSYLVYSILLNLFFFFLFPFFIALKFVWANNMHEIVEILLILPTSMVGLKCVLIVRNRFKLLQLFELLDQMDGMVQNDEERQHIRDAGNGSRILVVALSCEYYFSIFSFFFVALWTEGRVLMWASWFPFDYENVTAAYYAIMAFQFVSSLWVGFASASMDVYGLALYRLLRAHLCVLGRQLSHLGKYPVDANCKSATRRNIKCERELFKCIDYHNLCIRYGNRIIVYILKLKMFLLQFFRSAE